MLTLINFSISFLELLLMQESNYFSFLFQIVLIGLFGDLLDLSFDGCPDELSDFASLDLLMFEFDLDRRDFLPKHFGVGFKAFLVGDTEEDILLVGFLDKCDLEDPFEELLEEILEEPFFELFGFFEGPVTLFLERTVELGTLDFRNLTELLDLSLVLTFLSQQR